MNIDTPDTYFVRCMEALGQEAHNPVAVVRWCYDHPPRKAIPKANGERPRSIFISRRAFNCLRSMAQTAVDNGHVTVDAIADALLCMSVQDNAPTLWNMHERHEQEEQKLLAELRQNEPELHKEEPPFDQIPR